MYTIRGGLIPLSLAAGALCGLAACGPSDAPPRCEDRDCHTYSVLTLAGSRSASITDGTGGADGSASFGAPSDIAIDRAGNLYIAVGTADGYAVRKVAPDGATTTLFRANGRASGIAMDRAGDIYLSLNHVIVKVTSDGVASTIAGAENAPGYVEGPGTSARFNDPRGLGVDDAGNLYVSDRGNHRIRKIQPDASHTVSTLAGTGAPSAMDGPGARAGFYRLGDLRVGADGTIWVTDSETKLGPSLIRQIQPDGQTTTPFIDYSQLSGLAVDDTGIYVSQYGVRIVRFEPGRDDATLIAGGDDIDDIGFRDGIGCDARFFGLQGMALQGGVLYAADYVNQSIRRIARTSECPPPPEPVGRCASVTCPAGQRCDGTTGQCVMVDRCAGVTCSADEACYPSDGQCRPVNRCAGVTCAAGLSCDKGTGMCRVTTSYLKASNAQRGDRFGHSVSLFRDTLAVGVPEEASAATGVGGDQTSNGAPGSGAVYIFRRTEAGWVQEAYLKASNTGTGDRFGESVSLYDNALAVGAPLEASSATGVNGDQTSNSASQSGAVYLFRRTGTTWAQEAYLKASNTNEGDAFGSAVSMSGDMVSGDIVAVAAFREASAATGVGGDQANNGARASGAVYVFHRSGTTWAQEAYLKASNTAADDQFGWSLSLWARTLAVGASGEDSSSTGVNGDQANNNATGSGAVYLFQRTGTGWAQQAYLKASNTGAGDHFGSSVSLLANTLAVGAPEEASAATGINGDQADNSKRNSGAVYLFQRTDAGWSQQAYVKASNSDAMDQFGYSVSLSADALAVGAPFESSAATGPGGNQADNSAPAAGAVYLFPRTGSTLAPPVYRKAPNTDPADTFGFCVSLSEDALVVGAQNESSDASGVGGDQANNLSLQSGAVYVLAR